MDKSFVWRSVLCISILLSLGILPLLSQTSPTGSVSGRIVANETGSPLRGVNITIPGTRLGTTSDRNGEFKLTNLPVGSVAVIFEFIGYATYQINNISISVDEETALETVTLTSTLIPLSEVVVSPGSYSMLSETPSIRQTLSSEDIQSMGWAEDVTRAVRRVPGISADDYSARFSIRGGEVDEVLMLIDGMQIYRPFHQKDFGGGLFSTIDIETIRGLNLYTGGFAAGYGDRMSGVLDMQTKSAKSGERTTSIGLSLMNARLFSMGNFNSERGSWLFSARRGYLDLLNRLMNNAFKLNPNYYDVFGKLQFKLNSNHSIALYAFLANDAYNLNDVEYEKGKTVPNIDFVDTQYGNNYSWITLSSDFSQDVSARTMLYGGKVTQKRFWDRYDDDPNEHFNSALISDDRDMRLVGAKSDWDFNLSSHILLKTGVDAKHFNVTYDYSNEIQNEFITAQDSLIDHISAYSAAKKDDGNQIAVYLSSRFRLTNPLTLETGVRYNYTSYTNDKHWSPRINLAYALGQKTFLRAGWGHFYQSQGFDELDIQFGETQFQQAEQAEHFVLGLEHQFQNGLHLRAESYYKLMSNLRDNYYTFADIDEFFPEARDDLIKVTADNGTTRGIELFLRYAHGGKFSSWISYVLSDATDDVTDLQYDGRLVWQNGRQPRPMDQRHTLNIDTNYRLNSSWHFNLSWQFRSGWPGTDFVVGRIQRSDGSYAFYHDNDVYNGINLPSYQRLDARMNKDFNIARGKISVFLQVINLLNHENIIRYDHDIRTSTPETFEYSKGAETWFGITPFAGMSWEF